MTEQPEVLWAIVELFGHQRIAGQISEFNLGGTFVRVEVPSVGGRSGFTKLYGQAAIYAMTFVDRDVALAAAEKFGIAPVTKWDVGAMTTEAVRNRLEHSGMSDSFDHELGGRS
jgi:hypothetical protein